MLYILQKNETEILSFRKRSGFHFRLVPDKTARARMRAPVRAGARITWVAERRAQRDGRFCEQGTSPPNTSTHDTALDL